MNKFYVILAIIILALGAFFYVMNQNQEPTNEPASANATPEAVIAVVETSKGSITLELNSADAPMTVENFTKLARDGFYDGTKFHRVIPEFMIQGGDPLSRDDAQKDRWGTGGPGYTFEDEIHENNNNARGTIAMANAGPDTNGSQFFINVADNNFLDEKHTVFGRVTQGMEVVDEIVSIEAEGPDRPVDPIVINTITIQK